MAFTIQELETFSNTKPELRYVTEEIIKYLTANPPGDGVPGGAGLALEEYINGSMSEPVMAYVYRDEDNNIYGVIEPIRGNKIWRSQFAYADSIDLFPFDSVNSYDNIISDLKILNPNAFTFRGCLLNNLVINFNDFAGLFLNSHTHTGLFGETSPNGAEIYLSGANVTFTRNKCDVGVVFDRVGAAASITGGVFGSGCQNLCFGKSGIYYLDVVADSGAFIYVLKNNTQITSASLQSEATLGAANEVFDLECGVSSQVGSDVYNAPSASIVSIDTGTKTFILSGVHTSEIGQIIFLPTGTNSGVYTVNSVNDDGVDTTVIVNETITTDDTSSSVLFIRLFSKINFVTVNNIATLFSSANNIQVLNSEFGVDVNYVAGSNINHINVSKYPSKSGDPTTDQIPSGTSAIFKDSGSGNVKIWVNDAGALKSVTFT